MPLRQVCVFFLLHPSEPVQSYIGSSAHPCSTVSPRGGLLPVRRWRRRRRRWWVSFLSIVDRAKDVIKSGGEWISSIDLENAAASHPDVDASEVKNLYPLFAAVAAAITTTTTTTTTTIITAAAATATAAVRARR